MGEYWANFAYTGKPGRGRSGTLPQCLAWGAGNRQVLDAESDGGVRPEPGVLTMKSLYDQFRADDAFPFAQDKKRLLPGIVSWPRSLRKPFSSATGKLTALR